ncbi:hypothetical protein N7528_003199 [Penicillium herquei]|nr:hypothetical protein N7528_003199 [Penicillium herquei]
MLTFKHFTVFAYAFLLNLGRLWNLLKRPKSAQPQQPVDSVDRRECVSDPDVCRQLIEGKLTQGSNCNQLSFLQSRAIPNEGLRSIFGIENAFTSHDPELVNAFVYDARRRIKLKPEEWSALTPMLVDAARNMIVGSTTEGMDGLPGAALSNQSGVHANITSLVQVVTLKAILATVLKNEAKGCPSDLDILKLADQINKGWIRSRNSSKDGTDMLNFEHNEAIKTSLKAVFPHQAEDGSNPLNILLPSFETMWRVVLRLLLELKFRTSRENPEWAKVMISFCWNVNKEEFESRSGLRATTTTASKAVIVRNTESSPEKTPSAKDIVLEALRVYPPTRRIYRAYAWGDSQASHGPETVDIDDLPSKLPFRTVAADIEACHLRTDTWGSDAASFVPTRWMTTTRAQIHDFMPFGHGICECPAKAVFGPRMIGILVGALLSALDDGCQWKLWSADDNVMSHLARKERLSLERDAYDKLEVIQVCPSS